MPFIGQQPLTGAYSKLDAITTSATATYNLLLNGGAYSPASANHLLVSLNGVMQAPQDSFTVSGSTIIFDSALTSSDYIDFIMAMGDVLNIGTPSDGTVTAGKIATNAVTTAKIATNAVTTAKITDANITQAKLGSGVAGTGPAFSAHLSGNPGLTANTYTKMACNTELFDTDSCYDTSNYRFTPTVAGIYHCTVHVKVYTATSQTTFGKMASIYKNGSNYKETYMDGNFGYSNNNHHLIATALVSMNGSSDYLEAYARINVNGNIIGGGSVGNTFEAHMVRKI